jgi:hypothetical protein
LVRQGIFYDLAEDGSVSLLHGPLRLVAQMLIITNGDGISMPASTEPSELHSAAPPLRPPETKLCNTFLTDRFLADPDPPSRR